jgi:para-nitrobenzyl esterase
MGAVHSAELPYEFPHFSNTKALDGPDLGSGAQQLSDTMLAYWTSFAKTEVPCAQGSPAWTPFSRGARVMRLDQASVRYFDATTTHHCVFWQKLYPALLRP